MSDTSEGLVRDLKAENKVLKSDVRKARKIIEGLMLSDSPSPLREDIKVIRAVSRWLEKYPLDPDKVYDYIKAAGSKLREEAEDERAN